MAHANISGWQRLPISDNATPELTTASDSSSDEPPLESDFSYVYDQLISSVEKDGQDDNGKSENCNTSAPFQLAHNDAKLVTNFDDSNVNPFEGLDTVPDIHNTGAPRERPIAVEIPRSTLVHPKSIFEGFIPPAAEVRERHALAELLDATKTQQPFQEDGHIEFDLEEFSIYSNGPLYPHEFRPLQQLATRSASEHFYFDGVIRHGEKKFYLRKVHFRQLPIGNYGSEEHTVGDQIWVRSDLNERRDEEVYYKLKNPSAEYLRYYEPFLWIADLAKHVLDYCDYLMSQRQRAVLYDFKSRFNIWLEQKHTESATFRRWYSANRGSDFRGAILANINFIWKEAHGLDPVIVTWHEFWGETKTFNHYKPNLSFGQTLLDEDSEVAGLRKGKRQKGGQVPPTIVTPYIYDLFSHMVFGNVLKRVKPSADIQKKLNGFTQRNLPIEQRSPPAIKRVNQNRTAFIASIEVGDVISTHPDDEGTDTEWKQQKSKHYQGEHLWFGLVQKIHKSPKGRCSFDVIWLYQPIDTPCGIMKYPYNNEIFLSNNSDEIIATHSVEWFGNPSTSAEFFVRQTYLSDDCRWTTLKKEHLTCTEDKFHVKTSYKVGDVVLVETDPKSLQLEVFIIEGFFTERKKNYVKLRKLTRRRDVDKNSPKSPPNEVVYTNQLVEISIRRIFRHCLVRAFYLEEEVPSPYNHGGTGDLFFMTHQEIETEVGNMAYIPLDMALVRQLRQGFDPLNIHHGQKLQGLDLFCGGGNFGRGLEDGGAIEMRWANDIWREAIHTYMANSEPGVCTPFLGSVDDLLLRALLGEGDKIPRPGDVHFISAGSPCPGFSLLTPDRTTDDQRKNQSLVASFAAYVDLYRPYYGILENVPQMVNSAKLRDVCVFSQVCCALVGLGYQVQVMFLDAWSFGAPQSRSRVFLCFSAPGLRMPKVPNPSHSHPPGTRLKKLGEMSCGRPFDRRILISTPFKYVSIRDAIGDLPDIQDGKPDYCPGFPDHRLSAGVTPPIRKQLFTIPTQPWEMNFAKAWHGRPGMPRVMTPIERAMYPPDGQERTRKGAKGWGRIHPNKLFSTIATKCGPTDARIGCSNHWYQHRPLTVLEIRRAQGVRDDEVLVASPANQWRIVGNSVARQVSVALGLAVREAWFGTLFDEANVPQWGLASVERGVERGGGGGGGERREKETVIKQEDGDDVEMTDVGNGLDESDESTAPSEELFVRSTPDNCSSNTPATSVGAEFSDGERGRKRPSKLCVEILTKRQKFGGGDKE
ncbi:S-adenosyl-L-methionine-dependent methyltransferase [Annulohypoxylon truncatum]|uniref:S-adenosyl-L-methionine-dependent methyltransferase n=1 Tax=Annulohypoxylon truncatum TaxID=327061 RepID=UPI002008DBD6|nr:S-adenosyl-L-methionine-dependent methyltransferase [Annulohypoxylon truncatum]KAI1210229.1 S-adenosyl-L-methionine-dependent methyltransferase [Annulohypoxylon truncatum]